MNLNLTRPLAVLDLETTGASVTEDKIVEIGVLKVYSIEPHPYGLNAETFVDRVNPTIPIKPDAFKAHGISDEDVADKPIFAEVAEKYFSILRDCDIAGFCSNAFDAPLLHREFSLAGIQWDYSKVNFIDVGIIFKRREERTLTAAMKFYCKKNHEGAHGVAADTRATLEVLLGQFKMYSDLPRDIAELARYSNYDKPMLDLSGKFTTNKAEQIVFTFGDHKNEPAADWPDYLRWMLGKDFPADTKVIAKKILNGK